MFLDSLLNLLQYCYCFMFCFFGPEAYGILSPWPGIELTPLAVEGEVLTTGLPGKSCLSVSCFTFHHSFPTTWGSRSCLWQGGLPSRGCVCVYNCLWFRKAPCGSPLQLFVHCVSPALAKSTHFSRFRSYTSSSRKPSWPASAWPPWLSGALSLLILVLLTLFSVTLWTHDCLFAYLSLHPDRKFLELFL